jgi:hypothetical protein
LRFAPAPQDQPRRCAAASILTWIKDATPVLASDEFCTTGLGERKGIE